MPPTEGKGGKGSKRLMGSCCALPTHTHPKTCSTPAEVTEKPQKQICNANEVMSIYKGTISRGDTESQTARHCPDTE